MEFLKMIGELDGNKNLTDLRYALSVASLQELKSVATFLKYNDTTTARSTTLPDCSSGSRDNERMTIDDEHQPDGAR
jgi:hypothetical protein